MTTPSSVGSECLVRFLLLVSFLNVLLIRSITCSCPWDAQLMKWSESSTWRPDPVPTNGSTVTISGGRRVLLDVKHIALKSLFIAHGSALIWPNQPDHVLEADHIVLEGEFHMGSRLCPLNQPALIRLTGKSDNTNFVSDEDSPEIRKVILVRNGGTLELHGQKKTSWTRLAQTIYPLEKYICPYVYDHSDHKTNPFAKERQSFKNLHVIAWNNDASVFDYNAFETYTSLKEFIDNIPYGRVIGMFVYGSGLSGIGDASYGHGVLVDVITNTLGGELIGKVKKDDFYSLLTIKGRTNLTLEHYQSKGCLSENYPKEETFLQLPDWKRKLDFQVAMSPKTSFQYFRVLSTKAAYPILELADRAVRWVAGDKIVVASTDFDWEQAEVRELVQCRKPDCDPNKYQIRVKGPFRYMHYGNFTYNVDERAEVGLLSRKIVIEGVMEDECYHHDKAGRERCLTFGKDTFGGHIRVLRGHADVHVQGVELYHMGQQGIMGSYPLHFHMCDEARGSWFKDNSIHHSFQRCITIHGTDRVEISGNVCFDHLGHGYFLEDGVEQNNIIQNNLGLSTRHGTTLMSDMDKDMCKEDGKLDQYSSSCGDTSTFWITHPNNRIRNNAAAGGVRHGFMFVNSDMPLGLSYNRQMIVGRVLNNTAKYTAITEFYNNVAHSYEHSGVFLDSHISTGRLGALEDFIPENGVIQEENYYEPRKPAGSVSGRRVWDTKLERFTGYKNKRNNMWIKGGNLNVTYCTLADGKMQSFSGGCTGQWTGVSVEYSVFVGRTDNQGMPQKWKEKLPNGNQLSYDFDSNYGTTPWETIRGMAMYQGNMYVKHSYFDRFNTLYWNDAWTSILNKRPVSPAAAISFKRDSTYPTYTTQYSTNLTFGYCDNVDNGHWLFMGNTSYYGWKDEDGTKASQLLDKDGSLTGTPNTYIVRNRPFFTGPECTYRPDWDMSMCPYRYIKVEFAGEGGSLSIANRDKWALIARRDDASEDAYEHEGRQRREYLMRTDSSYLIDYNTATSFASWPHELKIMGHGVESQDVVRLGICIPKQVTNFEVSSDYPVVLRRDNFTKANSLAELDADTDKNSIFHDKKNGILFLKVWSLHDRTNDSQLCPDGKCYKIKIMFNKTETSAPIRKCFGKAVYDAYTPKTTYKKVPRRTDCFSQGSPEGIGALRWNEVKKIVHEDYEIPCPSPVIFEDRENPVCMGCFMPNLQNFTSAVEQPKSMTIEWCTLRCYQQRFKYCSLQGSLCKCGKAIDWSSESTNIGTKMCDGGCGGNKEQNCGYANRMAIWSTGMPNTNITSPKTGC